MLYFTLSWAATAVLTSQISKPHPAKCKAIPGTQAWPNAAEWDALNRTVAGRLLHPSPPAAVCHPSQPSYNQAVCKSTDWTDATTYANDPLGIICPNWSNDSCLPQPQYPCSGKGFPVYVINATSSKHIAAGVNFARQHDVRLNIKGSGHDYLGRYHTAMNSQRLPHGRKLVLISSLDQPLRTHFPFGPSISAVSNSMTCFNHEGAMAAGQSLPPQLVLVKTGDGCTQQLTSVISRSLAALAILLGSEAILLEADIAR